ncbi:DUF2170 family protein [uncultured Psychrosphaera sp.]|jgi:uncharacterized protein YjfI (DUF2170 family)|uniref:DUF2170 family protein n=1 Tax=uncultured Psychrosphaera sp. TaxID=1403522 RepID=UPI002617AE59|nr:DUF2170 family protein [uncultured Psychrosphaera sp.]
MTWSNTSLKTLAESQPDWVVEAEGDCLSISNDEGIDAFVYVGSQQIIVETALFPASDVTDKAALNDLILHSHHLLPLTAICINKIGDQDYYVAFGALSVASKDSVVVEEIETLFVNTSEFLDLYNQFLTQEKTA